MAPIFCLGSGLQAIACNMAMMLIGRVVAGFSVGLLSGNAPVYTSEIAPPKLRGAFGHWLPNSPLPLASCLAFLLALILEDVKKAIWRLALGHCSPDSAWLPSGAWWRLDAWLSTLSGGSGKAR